MTPQPSFGRETVCGMTATHTRTVSPGTRTPLQAARSQRGLSQEALAYRAGICVATLRRVERGLVSPTRGTRRLLADALNLPASQLFAERDGGRGTA